MFVVPLLPHLQRALEALRDVATTLRARIAAAVAAHAPATLPRRFRANPASAKARVEHALVWLAALDRTLAGDTFFLPPWRLPAYPRLPATYPALTNAIRASCGLPLNPPATPAQRAANRLRYMRKVFATQPVGVIAARIARRLAIARTASDWPTDLIAITETPAVLARPPKPQPAPQAAPQTPPFATVITPPEPHRRE